MGTENQEEVEDLVSKPLNEQRRELVQTLLVVGGIVGGLIATQPAYSSVSVPLVRFVFISAVFYSMMFIEKIPKTYLFAAFAVAGSFAYLVNSIELAVIKTAYEAWFMTVVAFVSILLALIVDWNQLNRSGQKPIDGAST
jgi:hypothetical protein